MMVCAIAAVSALAYGAALGESTAALRDFGLEQSLLAQSIAASVSARLSGVPKVSSWGPAELLSDVRSVERPSSLRLLLAIPGQSGLSTTDGHVVRDYGVAAALMHGLPWVPLSRTEAPGFALPRRTAVAGLSSFDGPNGRWSVVVAATAVRQRDREARELWRLVGSVLVASSLVLAFGGMALRKQRQELDLERDLAVAELQRQREEQLVRMDKLATLGALATGIAHEVSTPLGVIIGRAEQILPKVTNDELARKGIEAILQQGNRIDRVVRGFLNLARGESPPLEHVDPGTVARASAELVEHRFANAEVTLSLEVEPRLPAVACDPRLLEQVLVNLLLNACDACSEGGQVALKVRADVEKVAFVVTDDGTGITPEAAARAVEPFFTTKPVGQGTGLGLAIANEIVKHHGGELTLGPRRPAFTQESDGHRGTRACVELPVAKGRHD